MYASFGFTTYCLLTRIAYLRLNGVNAKGHPVFRELIRVKQYFEKIKDVESDGMSKRSTAVDKAVAQRFIRHALAANKPHDVNQAEQNEKIEARTRTRFEDFPKPRTMGGAQSAALSSQASSTRSSDSGAMTSGATALVEPVIEEGHKKRRRQSRKRGKENHRQANNEGKPRIEG